MQLADLYHTFSSILLEEYLSVCQCGLTRLSAYVCALQPVGVDGTPGDEPVPDSGVRIQWKLPPYMSD